MLRIKILLVSIFVFFFLNAFSQELEEKIEKFLLENPEVILKSLQNFEEKKVKEQEVTNEKIINENLSSLEDSSNGLYDGNINSKKIIVKFFDFNCSYCKKAHTDIQKLLKKEDVKVVYKNFPILSDNSVFLAKLGIFIAEKDTDSFNSFYKMINENKGRVSKAKLLEITKKLGVNLDELNNEKVNVRLEKKLKTDIDLANKLGLRGTPAFVVGNQIIFGYVPA
ncbi:MAG: DsbA family protein, partial [Alphaproteobacteria bacterium]